jgi:hypothetical protein
MFELRLWVHDTAVGRQGSYYPGPYLPSAVRSPDVDRGQLAGRGSGRIGPTAQIDFMTCLKHSRASKCACAWILAVVVLLSAGNCLGGTYTTTFTNSENPLSEGGKWINGGDVGLDWSNCFTVAGVVHGHQNNGNGPAYNDSTALLVGNWGVTQSVTVTLSRVSVVESDYPEAEIRLRSSLTSHSCTGYEVMWSLRTDSSCYVAIARWNGAFGDFTALASVEGAQYVITNGSVLNATITGDSIAAYINGVQVISARDSTYTSGNPGIGFDHHGPSSEDTGFGFSSFTVTDFVTRPPPPTGLHVVH